MPYLHGISVTEITSQSRSLRTIATAVIGLIATGPAADATLFPLDRPVKITDIETAIVKAGETGTLKRALSAIADQVRTPIVVVRVAPGADESATNLAVIGSDAGGLKSGMQALLSAEAAVGVRPRIIGAPGLDTQPVATQLAAVAKRLRAMAYAAAHGADLEGVIAYRSNFTARELMLIFPDFTTPVGVLGATEPSFAVARALGLRALIDQTQGWHKTLSNVPVLGVTGVTKDVQFDLQDPDADANLLNMADITTIVRINGKLRLWGNHTTSDSPDFMFESATRTAQIIADTIVQGVIWAIDKPLLPSLARDIVEKINGTFGVMKRAGQILGAEAWYDPAKNTVSALGLGKLLISYKYTPVPPLEQLGFEQEITDEYLADFSQLVVSA